MSFTAGSRRPRGGQLDLVSAEPAQDDDERSVDVDEGEEEEEEEDAEEEEEEGQEDDVEEEEEEADDDAEEEDAAEEEEQEEEAEGYDEEQQQPEGGEEEVEGDDGRHRSRRFIDDADDAGEEAEYTADDDDAAGGEQDGDTADEDDDGHEGVQATIQPPAAPFAFSVPFTSAAATSSAFPSFSMGSTAFPAPSSAPLSFSAPSSSSSFTFPSSAGFSVGQSGGSSASTTASFSFGASPATFPSTAAPFSFTPSPSTFPSTSSSSSSLPFSFGASSPNTALNPASSFSLPSSASVQPAPSSSSSAGAASSAVQSASSAASTAHSSSAAASSATSSAGVIAVPTAARGVCGVWGSGDELFLYPDTATNRGRASGGRSVAFAGSDVFRFQWPSVYGETSGLLHAWHSVFVNTHQQQTLQATQRPGAVAVNGAPAALRPFEWRRFLVEQSHCYRAELDACLYRAAQSLTAVSAGKQPQQGDPSSPPVSTAEYHAHLLLLESAASMWQLFELAFLDLHDSVTVQLVDWMQRSVTAPHTQGLQADSDEWWTAVLQLLLQGRLSAVVELLTAAISSPSSPFSFLPSSALRQLLELLQNLPSLTVHTSNVHQLVSIIRDYQLSVQHLASSTPAFQSHPYIPVLLSILAGDDSALVALCEDWTQLLVSELLFVQPQMLKQDLPALVQQCVLAVQDKEREEGGPQQAASPPLLSQLRQDVLCFRVHSAVLLLDQMLELPFFTAHLVDLLHLAGVMPTLQSAADKHKSKGARQSHPSAGSANGASSLDMTPRDWYLWQYVQSIQQHDRLWTLAPDYIQAIGSAPNQAPGASTPSFSPIHALCSLLLAQRCGSVTRVLQLLQLCSRHQLPSFVSQRLCERFGNAMLRAGQTGAAVHWYERSGEVGKRRIQQIATRLLDRLIQRREPAAGDEQRMDDGDAAADVDGVSEGDSIEKDEAEMEAVLDNVNSAVWLDEESGSVELVLLSHWREFASTRRQLRAASAKQLDGRQRNNAKPPPINLFQLDLRALTQRPVAVDDDDDDGMRVDGHGGLDGVGGAASTSDDRLALTQRCLSLLISLLTSPLLQPAHRPPLYTPQSLHLSLLQQMTSLLSGVQDGDTGGEDGLDGAKVMEVVDAAALQATLDCLNRCELSWRWTEWRRRSGVDEGQLQAMRRTLLYALQTQLLMEETAKRVDWRL